MSFEIDADDHDEFQDNLEQMGKEAAVCEIQQWCQKIVAEAKLKCAQKEQRERIVLDCVSGVEIGEVGFSYDDESKEALPFLRDAIEKNLSNMPINTRTLFKEILNDIEKTIDEKNSR